MRARCDTGKASDIDYIGIRPITAIGSLLVPDTGFVLPADRDGFTALMLTRRRIARRGKRLVMVGIGLGHHIAEPIRPAAVVLDDHVMDFGHGRPFIVVEQGQRTNRASDAVGDTKPVLAA